MNKVKIVGIGPGHKDYILPIAFKAVEEADILVGAKRHLDIFETYNKEMICYQDHLEEMVQRVEDLRHSKNVVVLVSGDPGFYSLLDYIQRRIHKDAIEIIPGISSFQYFFSKLNRSYKSHQLLSLHGRDIDFNNYLAHNKGIFLLTDQIHTPSVIAKQLIKLGYKDYQMAVGENLSYDDERIVEGKVLDFIDLEFKNLCVAVINNELG